ncbi:hypothetical protein COS83_03885 [archaeon CG07_land_8_20_14_0_80_38_8]|nr:MAG: hypothetical protein COS83_03885 [archaeon CG07_land_8_20_14_0_80_38_8]PIU89537.1 MAG: hypothetical protein COS64_00425 [archaeon CG06_land_8_20_14_3_00_37_11]
MKVLLVSSNFPPQIGGPAASIEYVSKILSRRGVANAIVTNGTDEKYNDASNVIRTPVVSKSKHSIIGSFMRMYYLFMTIMKQGREYDLFHAQDVNVSGFPTMLAALILGKPYVLKFSGDLYIEYMLRKNKSVEYALNSNNIVKSFFGFVQRLICNNSAFTIATSEYVKFFLLKMGVKRDKIKLIPNGVIKQAIDKKIMKSVRKKYGSKIVCSSCRITEIKGIGLLINAAKELRDYNFVMFGEGKDLEYFRKKLKSEGLTNFYFHGRVNHKKVQSYIKACDVFVLASYYEPFGIAVLDALCADIPVIVSSAGGMKEIVKNNTGLVFKKGDCKDLINKIKNTQKVNLKNQKLLVKNYYWDRIVGKYIEEYERILE